MSAVSSGGSRALAPGAKPPLAVPRRLLKLRSDAALAERVALGDEAAFDVLYERHRPVVLAVCMGILGAQQDAEDATQETFSALALALRSKPPAELRPWLIRVARNASIDTTRRRKHRLLTIDGEIPDIPVRPNSGKAELDVVMHGIRELPEQQRTALLMRELGGHSYAEIADFLETDEDAVRGLIARARVGLRSYREATELPCATARACIETEPDGRRYDKTVRRHLRGCSSCRGYREALRGDAKALRAALPLQTSATIGAGGGLTAGAFSAGKAALLSTGMTQVAAACAASVCAVGTVGGIVVIEPFHHLLGDHYLKPAAAAGEHHKAHHKTVTPAHSKASAAIAHSTYIAPTSASDVAPTPGAHTLTKHGPSGVTAGTKGTKHAQPGWGGWHHVPVKAVSTLAAVTGASGIADATRNGAATQGGDVGGLRNTRWNNGNQASSGQAASGSAGQTATTVNTTVVQSSAPAPSNTAPITTTSGGPGSGQHSGWGQQPGSGHSAPTLSGQGAPTQSGQATATQGTATQSTATQGTSGQSGSGQQWGSGHGHGWGGGTGRGSGSGNGAGSGQGTGWGSSSGSSTTPVSTTQQSTTPTTTSTTTTTPSTTTTTPSSGWGQGSTGGWGQATNTGPGGGNSSSWGSGSGTSTPSQGASGGWGQSGSHGGPGGSHGSYGHRR